MGNKNRLCISLFLALLIFSLFSANLSDYRPIWRRIHSISSKNYHSGVVNNTITSSSGQFYYNSDTASWADSIIITDTYEVSGETPTITNYSICLNSINESNDIVQLEYLQYTNNSSNPSKKFNVTSNLSGKLVSYSIFNFNNNQWNLQYSWSCNYNSYGKPDFILTDQGTYHYKYSFEYGNNNRLTTVTQSKLINNNWNPMNRKLLNYVADVQPLANQMQFLNFRLMAVYYGVEDLQLIYDTKYLIQSVSFQVYNGSGGWIDTSSSTHYSSYIAADSVSLISQYSDSYYFSTTNKYFNSDGLYTGYNSAGMGSYGYCYVSWEDYVANEDEYQQTPTTPLMIRIYPNPFRTNLNIKLESKTPINSDINIYNIKGQLIRSWKGIKSNQLTWDGKDKDSKPVRSGVYLIKVGQGRDTSVVKVIKL